MDPHRQECDQTGRSHSDKIGFGQRITHDHVERGTVSQRASEVLNLPIADSDLRESPSVRARVPRVRRRVDAF